MAAGEFTVSHPASRKPTPGARTARDGPPATSTAGRTWPSPPRLRGGIEDPDKGGYIFKIARRRHPRRQDIGPGRHRRGRAFRPTARPLSSTHKDGRLVMEIERQERGRRAKGARRLACQEDQVGPRLRDHPGRQEKRRSRRNGIRQPLPRHQDARQAVRRLGDSRRAANGSATQATTSKCCCKTSATPKTRRSASWAAQLARVGGW